MTLRIALPEKPTRSLLKQKKGQKEEKALKIASISNARIVSCPAGFDEFQRTLGQSRFFRIKKTDSGSTTVLKALLGLGWAYGSLIVAVFVCMISALWLITAAIAAALGG